jgi:DNA-binding LacI/PurR family transcriptional regulator
MPRKRLTVDDVAAAAGVSKAAVSRVLNNTPGASTETREHVRRVIARLGFRPHPAARALARGHGDVIDLVVMEDDLAHVGANPFYSRVTTGVFQAIADEGVQLRLHVVDEARAASLPERIAESGSQGTLLVNVPPELAVVFRDRGEPVVSMGRSAPGVPSIVPENRDGAYAALRHLYATGRRRIAAVHGPRWSPCAVDRGDGYRAAMSDAGLQDVAVHGPFRREAGYELARSLMAREPHLDAVFAACDLMATGVMQALAESGRRIPDDVAVIGFDDGPIAACTVPPMSSVHQPVERMAATAARALIDRKLDSAWQRTFPTTLTVRATSG